MTAKDLKPGVRVWCWWKSRYMWYVGKAHNGKDYKFTDIADAVFYMNAEQVGKLEKKSR